MIDLLDKVKENTDSALAEIAEATHRAGRKPEDVAIMAVTKTHPSEYMEAAVKCGIRHIGENRISEGGRKIRLLGKEFAEFHSIGVLHRKEVRQAVRDFHWLDAVHKIEIIEEIARRNATVQILLEINTSGESAKKGFPPDVVLLESILGRALELQLPVRGFLTIGPLCSDPVRQRKAFSDLRELRDSLETRLNTSLPVLSMGMSDDFTLAVLEGSTMVRLGRRLFGARGN
ncbi:MAG: YggS family pyridoxal phosphate-dependent enzyme [Candidatus Fermentibacteria bacterium]|nr:YggS family pyridoxal phosphate-dependent enzyme [Candidatus Fermentibacteria bacterium]